jgi:pimeloyl-ACP methyl ester carboxylesterase/DNA-binding CsgD family transcriptional regulator
MDAPPVQYVKTSDGYDIAYGVCGSGPPLLEMPDFPNHFERMWGIPSRRLVYEAFARRFRFVQYDPRGMGNSSRGLRQGHAHTDYVLDLEAVVDALGLKQFVLFAAVAFSQTAILYAARHRDRLAALVLVNPTSPEDAWGPAYRRFGQLARDSLDFFLQTWARNFYKPDEQEYYECFRTAVNADDLLIAWGAGAGASVASVLPSIRVPTLVMASRSPAAPEIAAAGRTTSAAIPGARLVSFDGATAADFLIPAGSEPAPGMVALEEFLKSVSVRDLAAEGSSDSTPSDKLSMREIEVLRLVAAGRSNQQIADELVISQNTVIRHVSNIFAKTGVANRAEAASYAHRNGIV